MRPTRTLSLKGTEATFITETDIEDKRVKNINTEEKIVKAVINSLRETDVFYDVGANIGIFSLLACSKLSKGHVYSFEPHKGNYERLLQNVELNSFDNITCYNYALFDTEAYMLLESRRDDPGEGKSQVRPSDVDSNPSEGGKETECIRGDVLTSHIPNVMKVDVEGAEVRVLKGMKNKLSNNGFRVGYIEAHPNKMMQVYGDSIADMLSVISDCGLAARKIHDRGGEIFYEVTRA